MITWTLLVLALFVAVPPSAHAYLDPGSGSMMIQLLLAGFAGAAVGLKVFWSRILSFFGRSKKAPSSHDSFKR